MIGTSHQEEPGAWAVPLLLLESVEATLHLAPASAILCERYGRERSMSTMWIEAV
jgi:hypothetical protein